MKLFPCPFCGGTADIERVGTLRVSTIITCQWCGASLETNESGESIGAKWNDRHGYTPCDHELDEPTYAYRNIEVYVFCVSAMSDVPVGKKRLSKWQIERILMFSKMLIGDGEIHDTLTNTMIGNGEVVFLDEQVYVRIDKLYAIYEVLK